jgi:hypothetical protein
LTFDSKNSFNDSSWLSRMVRRFTFFFKVLSFSCSIGGTGLSIYFIFYNEFFLWAARIVFIELTFLLAIFLLKIFFLKFGPHILKFKTKVCKLIRAGVKLFKLLRCKKQHN